MLVVSGNIVIGAPFQGFVLIEVEQSPLGVQQPLCYSGSALKSVRVLGASAHIHRALFHTIESQQQPVS